MRCRCAPAATKWPTPHAPAGSKASDTPDPSPLGPRTRLPVARRRPSPALARTSRASARRRSSSRAAGRGGCGPRRPRRAAWRAGHRGWRDAARMPIHGALARPLALRARPVATCPINRQHRRCAVGTAAAAAAVATPSLHRRPWPLPTAAVATVCRKQPLCQLRAQGRGRSARGGRSPARPCAAAVAGWRRPEADCAVIPAGRQLPKVGGAPCHGRGLAAVACQAQGGCLLGPGHLQAVGDRGGGGGWQGDVSGVCAWEGTVHLPHMHFDNRTHGVLSTHTCTLPTAQAPHGHAPPTGAPRHPRSRSPPSHPRG